MRRPELAAELIAMAAEDRRVRAELAVTGELFDGYHPRMRAVHRANGDRLAAIVDELGAWPGIGTVGTEAAGAAWMLAQHDIAAPALMRRNLELYRAAVEAGDAESAGVAYLEDRIRAFEGRPQCYGTQLGWDEHGSFGVWPPVEDPEGVNERRAALGLEPLDAHIERAREGMPCRVPSASELSRDRERADAFARSTGWR